LNGEKEFMQSTPNIWDKSFVDDDDDVFILL